MNNLRALNRFLRAKQETHADRTILCPGTSTKAEPDDFDGYQIIDAGIQTRGSLNAGILLAELCMAASAQIDIVPTNALEMMVDHAVYVRTDNPVEACLGAQYAGWPVQTDDFFCNGQWTDAVVSRPRTSPSGFEPDRYR